MNRGSGGFKGKSQPPMEIGFDVDREGEARTSPLSVTPLTAPDDSSASTTLMEQVLARGNLRAALQRVVSNDGAPGVDGRTVGELKVYLVTAWPEIKERLRAGTYVPGPVRAHAIPKAGGGERILGIPNVLDRLIQQALLQVLQGSWDATFSEHSYGFRPGRSAHQAVERARGYVAAGRGIVVDVDLEKFFDRVNHDVLMDRVARRVTDKRVLKLIRGFLNAGMMANGVVMQRHEGTPQGGPLSPLLANLLLNEVDRELERRGHAFVRYADDLNVYVATPRAGERVMQALIRMFARLQLKVNTGKSAVAPVAERQFLGFRLVAGEGEVRALIAPQARERLRERVRTQTRRTTGRTVLDVIADLSRYLRGWSGYYGRADETHFWRDTFGWIGHRLRALLLRQWGNPQRAYQRARQLGASDRMARGVAVHQRRWWYASSRPMNAIVTTRHLLDWGLYDLRCHAR